MAEMSIKKVFKQHNSLVVTLPVVVRKDLGVERGDYLVFEWVPNAPFVKLYKHHQGVERRYADYGSKDLRHQGRGKHAKGAR